jgi:hypothetical protein
VSRAALWPFWTTTSLPRQCCYSKLGWLDSLYDVYRVVHRANAMVQTGIMYYKNSTILDGNCNISIILTQELALMMIKLDEEIATKRLK